MLGVSLGVVMVSYILNTLAVLSSDIEFLKYVSVFTLADIRKYNDDYGYAGFTNDIDGGMLFYPKYINEGKMYQLVDAIDFIEYAQKSNSQKMKEVAATLTEESNPVMVVATLKE